MNKKIIYSALALALMTSVVGCQDDEYVAPDSFCDVAWTINQTAATEWSRNQGDWAGFLDMSVGATSHIWEIEKGNQFLISYKYNNKDNEDFDFTPFIKTENIKETEMGLSTTDKQVNVLFNNPGTSIVRLRNVFPESVTWAGSNPITSYYDENEKGWVLDTMLEMTVYPKIAPAFSIYKDAACTELVLDVPADFEVDSLDSSTWKKVTIEAAESLYYVDKTTDGSPAEIAWYFPGASAATRNSPDSVAMATYYSMGEFEGAKFTGSRKAPDAVASVTKYVPLVVEVIKSTQPFAKTATPSIDGTTITVNVTGELASIGSLAKEDFTVYVTNEDAGITTLDPSLLTVAGVDIASDPTQISLSVTGEYYNSDKIYVEYKGSTSKDDAIVSVDERTLSAFDMTEVTLPANMFATICTIADKMNFEIPGSSGGSKFDGWWCNPISGAFYLSTIELGESMASSGSASLKFYAPQGTAAVGSQFQSANGSVPLGVGDYIVRFDAYIASSANSGLSNINMILQGAGGCLVPVENVARDQWVQLEATITAAKAMSATVQIKVNNHDMSCCANDDVLVYIDNITVFKKQPRQ